MTSGRPATGPVPATFATGGGGTVFELDIATWLAVSMAAGRTSPLGGRPIALEFQTGVAGFDDIRVRTDATAGPSTLDIQARHRQRLTSTDEKFKTLVEGGCKTIADDPRTFAARERRLVLVAAPDSPALRHLHDLCSLARSNPSADPDTTVAKARTAVGNRWQHLQDAAPGRATAELWTFAANLDVVAVDLSSRTAPAVTAVLNEIASLWQPSSTANASDALNAIFRLIADLIPAGGSLDEEGLRGHIPTLPPCDAEPSRRTRLHRVTTASRARIAGSMRALGVRDEKLLGDLVDHSLADSRPVPNGGVWLVQGDMGVGKSAVLERGLQSAVERSLADPEAPVPVHARATEAAKTPLRELILSRARETGDPNRTGIWLVLDGLDEAGLSAADVAEELVSLHAELPPSTFLVGTRPGASSAGLDVHPLRPLDDDATTALLDVLGLRPIARHGSGGLATTLQRPLFAILYAIHRADGEVTSPAELLDRMARSGMADLAVRVPDAIGPLTLLAANVLDASGAPVALAGLHLTAAETSAFVRSRLVDMSEGRVGFQVAALTEWFGGAALRGDLELLAAVASDPHRAHSWRYAAASMVAQLTTAHVDAAMEVLVNANPALARWALDRATSTVWGTPPVPPRAEAAATAVNRAFRTWHHQLAPLSTSWRDGDQQPPVIGVSSTDNGITCAVRALDDLEIHFADASIFPSAPPSAFLPRIEGVTWLPFRSGRISPGAAWAWDLTSKIHLSHLKRMIKSGDIAATSDALFPELLWRYAAATQAGPSRRVVAVDQVAAAVQHVRDNIRPHVGAVDTIHVGSGNSAWDVATAEHLVEHCRRTGVTQIERPWAPPPWNQLNPDSLDTDALLRSLEAASDAGLAAYREIVTHQLARLAPFLPLASILPVRVRGWVAVVPSHWQKGVFDIDHGWTIEPAQDPSEISRWEVVDKISFDLANFDEGRVRIERLRPNAPPNAYNGSSHGLGPWKSAAPATALALQRLAEDLKAYSWYEHTIPHDPPFIAPVFPPAD